MSQAPHVCKEDLKTTRNQFANPSFSSERVPNGFFLFPCLLARQDRRVAVASFLPGCWVVRASGGSIHLWRHCGHSDRLERSGGGVCAGDADQQRHGGYTHSRDGRQRRLRLQKSGDGQVHPDRCAAGLSDGDGEGDCADGARGAARGLCAETEERDADGGGAGYGAGGDFDRRLEPG